MAVKQKTKKEKNKIKNLYADGYNISEIARLTKTARVTIMNIFKDVEKKDLDPIYVVDSFESPEKIKYAFIGNREVKLTLENKVINNFDALSIQEKKIIERLIGAKFLNFKL